MGLRFDPMGGGQFKQAVQAIIEAERQPIKTLEARKAKQDARTKLFQDFKTKFTGMDKFIQEISTFRKLRELKVELGDGDKIVSVTLDKEKAEPGQYLLEIDKLATRSSSISNGFESADEPVLGMGFITMNLENGGSAEIFVDEAKSSLHGVASIINQQAESPVRAAVFKDDSEPDNPFKLMLVGKKEGAINQIDIPDFYFLDSTQPFYVDDNLDAENAEITVDGFEIESQANNINDFLPGVNLHLKQAKPEQPFFMTITEDYPKIAGKVKGLVDQINQVLQFITKQNAIDQNTDTSSTFGGDASFQSIEYSLRNIFHEPYQVEVPGTDERINVFMNELGIEFEKTGQITFKEDKFTKAIEKNFDAIALAVSGPNGFASRLRTFYDSYARTYDGLLSVKEKGLRARIKDIDDQIDRKNTILDKRKQNLTDQFSRLQATLGKLQQQQQYLSATLGGGGGANMLQQLMGSAG